MNFDSNNSQNSKDEADLESIWSQLGEMKSDDTNESQDQQQLFDLKINAYKDGYEDGVKSVSQTSNVTQFPKMMQSSLALAASAAVVFFILGFLINDNRSANAELQAELRSIKEMVVVKQLEQPSVFDRVQGLRQATEWFTSDDSQIELLFNTLRSDPSDTVKLAALDALRPQMGSASFRANLIEVFHAEASTLIKFEILYTVIQFGTEEEYLPMAEHMKQLGHDPLLIDRMLGKTNQRI
jgi:hypothetical protein